MPTYELHSPVSILLSSEIIPCLPSLLYIVPADSFIGAVKQWENHLGAKKPSPKQNYLLWIYISCAPNDPTFSLSLNIKCIIFTHFAASQLWHARSNLKCCLCNCLPKVLGYCMLSFKGTKGPSWGVLFHHFSYFTPLVPSGSCDSFLF